MPLSNQEDQVPIPLKPRVDATAIKEVKLKNDVRIGGTAARPILTSRTFMVPQFDGGDIESLIRTVTAFERASRANELDIFNNGPQLKSFFSKCLVAGGSEAVWIAKELNHPGQQVIDFDNALTEFMNHYMKRTAFKDQCKYLTTTKKKMGDSVQKTYERVTWINSVSLFLRGLQGQR